MIFRNLLASQNRRYSGQGYNFTRWFSPSNIFSGSKGNTLASNETIFAAVSRLSNSMASLPIKLYREFSPVSSRVADLVANTPNANMTSFEFIRTLEVMRDTHGNGYALKMYDDRFQVEQLLLLDPSRVEPVIEEKTGELWYEINAPKGRYVVHNMDMIHVKHIATIGHSLAYNSIGYKGISPIDVLRNTVDFDQKVRQFSLDTMDGAIKASFILKMATNLSPEKKQEILGSFKQFYRENGGVIIQESGVEIDPIERSFIDSKVFEVEKITKSRVAMVYNMPVHMLGMTEGVNYNSMEQLALDFVQNTLVPIVRQYEQELNRKLLTPQERQTGLYFKFNLGALLRGDTKTRGEFYFKGIRSGWFKPNEVRAFEELPPEPGGDKLYMSKDLAPIDDPSRTGKGVKPE
jgi:HK97 family phage portal protein